jgi:UDP-N-acetylglucosamine 1-carboxyvinyltransferase
MQKFLIEGGHPVSGRVTPQGNKNEALPCLAAALLTDEQILFHNVPRIQDVEVMISIIAALGASVEWVGQHSVAIRADHVADPTLDADLCRKIRASILFAGPVVARLGEVVLPPPGGDVIGRRRLDTHLHGLEALGASVRTERTFRIVAPEGGLVGTDFFFDEQSVTATENLVMASSLARGRTVLTNVAMEPHVRQLCHLLVAMGASIEGIGTPTLIIEGVERLGGAEHTIGPDYLEVGSLAGLAAVTGGDLTIDGVHSSDLRMMRIVLDRLGVATALRSDGPGLDDDRAALHIPGAQELCIRPDYSGHIPKIDDSPWPGFPTDLMSVAITVATQSSGTVLFFEKMFEGRMFFVDNLIAMGAQIILCDPHRVVVVGKSPLYRASHESPDIRAGMALLIAAACARGTSEISNIGQIDRGYEDVDAKLTGLGLALERVES